ncbi:hypothetical protein F4781DRAFT_441657 [Annulohypoxylon bovei var. microspora]|nr:hypothetical protein F4781DRAFT_441657 [Annulohypoxylon bovei var. microspora]
MPTLPPGLLLHPATATRGRSVYASQAFGAGSTIAVVTDSGPSTSPSSSTSTSASSPFPSPSIALPSNPHLSNTCSHCLRVTAALLASLNPRPSNPGGGGPVPGSRGGVPAVRACTGCRVSHYCSVACQKRDWRLVHGNGECAAFKAASAPAAAQILPSPVRALVQVLLRPDMREAVAEMEGHADKTRVAPGTLAGEMMLQVTAALHCIGREQSQKNIDEGIDITRKLQVNSFNREEADFGQSGVYINAALAMINHSCMPNAYISFSGRKAILHANQDIKEGEEITISYTNNPYRTGRRYHLSTHYYFKCECPKCKDNLDVYQVCQMYPNLELNSSDPFSLVRDVDKLRNPPVQKFINSDRTLERYIEKIYPLCMAGLDASSKRTMHQQLRDRWKMCLQLRDPGLYAAEPLYKVLSDVSVELIIQGKLAYGFAIVCFLALNSEPYISPAPFSKLRVKGVLMMVKILTFGSLSESTKKSSGVLAARLRQITTKIDQPTMCHILLMGIIHHSPAAHSDKWQPIYEAEDSIEDLKCLAGRETENALVDAFAKNPNGPEERHFFNSVVLEPIQTMAGFALEVLCTEFDE